MAKNAQYLHFQARGQYFTVNKKGEIKSVKSSGFSPTWIILGFSTHHWRSFPDIPLEDAFKHPHSIVKGLVWDKDHGTTRVWGGRYAGKLPRVTAAWVNDDPKV
jgi:hypothetical protein